MQRTEELKKGEIMNTATPELKSELGMTLRDYFAAKALQGWLASYSDDSRHPAKIEGGAMQEALFAYRLADAMLEARR